MKGSIGTTTSIYHTRLPHQRSLERMARCLDLSREAEARLAVFRYIEGFYSPRRRYSALDYKSPAEYERMLEVSDGTVEYTTISR